MQGFLGSASALTFADKKEPDESKTERPSFGTTLSSSFLDETSIGSAVTGDTHLPYYMTGATADLSFEVPEIEEKYIPFADEFLFANNQQEFDDIKADLDNQIEYDRVSQASGVLGIATDIAVQFVDPINYVPFLNQVNKAKSITVGSRVLETGFNFAKAGAKATLAQEAILQATQRGRSVEESVTSIGSATLFSGLIGAGVGKFIDKVDPNAKQADLDEAFYKEMTEDTLEGKTMPPVDIGDSSVGAMKFEEVSEKDLMPSKGIGIERLISKVPVYRNAGTTFDPFTNPLLRTMYNGDKQTKIETLKLAEFPLRLEGHDKGTFVSPPNSQAAIRRDQSEMLLPSLLSHQDGYKNYIKRMKKEGVKPLNKEEFNREVYLAMDRGDVSSIPEVQKVASDGRKYALTPALEEIRATGRNLPDSPKDAESYVMRNYNVRSVRERETKFLDILSEQFSRYVSKAEDAVVKTKKQNVQAKLSPDDVREIAREVSTKIQNLPTNKHVSALEFDLSSLAKTAGGAENLKKRSLFLDDDIKEVLVREGFIETDFELNLKKYMGTVMRDVRVAQHIGDTTGDKAKLRIMESYDQKITLLEGKKKAAKEGSKEYKEILKQERKLKKQRDADLSDFQGMLDRITGRYNQNQTDTESIIKNLNTMRFMGSVVESALPDGARAGLTQASGPIFRQSMGILKDLVANPKKYKMSVKQAQDLTVATDRLLGGRFASIADIADDVKSLEGRGAASAVSDFTGKFFNHTGANLWNEAWETVVSTSLSSEAVEAAGRFVSGKASVEDMAKFSEGGMSKAQIRTVYKMFKKYGEKDRSLSILNMDRWDPVSIDEKRAINAFKDMIGRSTETLIITPGQDTSLWGSKGIGSLIMQFKSFGQASLMRSTFLYGQRIRKNPADFSNYIALVTQLGLGASVTALRLYFGYLAGSSAWEQARGWSTERWVLEGVDRSGVLGSIMDTWNTVGQPLLSTSGVPGIQPLTRFQQRNAVDRALGPSMGLIYDAWGAVPALTNPLLGESPTQANINSLRRLMPYQNYIGLRYLIDGGMRSIYDEFDVPKSKKIESSDIAGSPL